jgi:hypothetical protein
LGFHMSRDSTIQYIYIDNNTLRKYEIQSKNNNVYLRFNGTYEDEWQLISVKIYILRNGKLLDIIVISISQRTKISRLSNSPFWSILCKWYILTTQNCRFQIDTSRFRWSLVINIATFFIISINLLNVTSALLF